MAFAGGEGAFGGAGGFGGGYPGYPGAGAGLNLDIKGGAGLGGLGGILGGGFPGWGVPYVPITPLGALGGIKGDLIVPIVAIGVALFLLVLIVLAVKYALMWKLSVLEDLGGAKKWKREAGSAAAPQLEDDYMIQLAKIVTSAIYSGSCSDRMICEVGAFARGNAQTVKGLISLVDSYVPDVYQPYLDILKTSAEGTFDCGQKYQCQQGQGQPGKGAAVDNKGAASAAPSPASAAPPAAGAPHQLQQRETPMQHPNDVHMNFNAVTPRPLLKDLFNASGVRNATTTTRPVLKLGKFRRYEENQPARK